MKLQKSGTLFLCRASVIAALYAVLTFFSFGFASGAVQFRLSEALCVLAVFTPAAVPGLCVGCAAANLISGCPLWDVLFGSLATLVGALGVRALRKYPFLAPLPYVAANAVAVPLILSYVYRAEGSFGFFVLTVGGSELVTAFGGGILLYLLLRRYRKRIF